MGNRAKLAIFPANRMDRSELLDLAGVHYGLAIDHAEFAGALDKSEQDISMRHAELATEHFQFAEHLDGRASKAQ